jgi:aminoglycoside phosphotransferase (APT) family kinase protein
MRFEPIDRDPGAFQQPVPSGRVESMCRRAFGPHAQVVSAVELSGGLYNTTYRVDVDGVGPVILRVSPEPGAQSRIERELMRNEHAALPFLAPIADLVPRALFADFSHQILGRDYLFQTVLAGVPAPEGLSAYARPLWAAFYRQLGEVTATVHDVRGDRFGPIAGPVFVRWSDAVIAVLEDTAADLEDAGLDASDLRKVMVAADARRTVLDQVTEPRFTTGDLWVPNVMLDPGADVPAIIGALDFDRAAWGDPASDWTIFQAGQKPGTEVDHFWEAYGSPDTSPDAAWRALIYHARHVGAIRLERHRLGRVERIPASYDDMRAILTILAA